MRICLLFVALMMATSLFASSDVVDRESLRGNAPGLALTCSTFAAERQAPTFSSRAVVMNDSLEHGRVFTGGGSLVVAGTSKHVRFFEDDDNDNDDDDDGRGVVPEPSTLTLLAIGLLGMGALLKRKRPLLLQ